MIRRPLGPEIEPSPLNLDLFFALLGVPSGVLLVYELLFLVLAAHVLDFHGHRRGLLVLDKHLPVQISSRVFGQISSGQRRRGRGRVDQRGEDGRTRTRLRHTVTLMKEARVMQAGRVQVHFSPLFVPQFLIDASASFSIFIKFEFVVTSVAS